MKQILTFLFLGVFCLSFAQTKDSLSVEEQQRREKNIQAGNPFKKFGYTPKIHTLSKGKYLEFHDLDSIVKIGSFSYHVKKKAITGYTKQETRYSEATLRPEIVSRWFSPDPLSEEFPEWSPYNFVKNNPINMIDPDGRAPVDWIKSNLTGKIEWRNDVTSANNTPKNYTYVGNTDNSIVANLFGNSNFSTSDRDAGLISVEDFDNAYSAKGAAFNNISTKTTLSVGLQADVSTTLNSDGSIASKEFNGVNINVSVSGEVNAPYPGVDIKLAGNSITLGGNQLNAHTPLPTGEFIQGGDVPTLTFDGFLSANSIQSQFRSPTNIGVDFKGQYSNNGFPMSYLGAAGLLGIPNPTKLNLNLPLNNTANQPIIDQTNK